MTRMAWMTPVVFLGAVLMMPQAAHAEKNQSKDAVQGKCNEKGGVYFPPGKAGAYACLYKDGSGIVCGGAKEGCDKWPASRPLGSRPKRAQELGMPEKPPNK